MVVWEKTATPSFYKAVKDDNDIFFSRSRDPAVAWTEPALLNNSGVRDRAGDGAIRLGFSGNGDWVAVWDSQDSLDDTVGGEPDIMVARSHDDCSVAPLGTCVSPAEPGRGRIKLINGPGDADKLVWKMRDLPGVTMPDLGDPTAFDADSAYTLCLYDDDGSGPQIEMEKDMPGFPATCPNKACWKARGSGNGFSYRDRRQHNGAVKGLAIRIDGKGVTNLKLQAKGAALGPPIMPFAAVTPVTLQLINQETGACWESVFGSPDTNTTELFKASSD